MDSKKFRLIISPSATDDLDHIIEYYETKKEGLGERFYRNFMGVLTLLLNNPFLYAKILFHFRKAIISPFPYSLYYVVDKKQGFVKVVAIIHQARSKNFIRKTLKP